MDWLDETISLFDEFESPKRFYYWSLLSSVSAILRDKVWVDGFQFKIHPNIYVLLYGPSAVKKGPPISLAKYIVSEVNNTKVINGRSTVEGIIKELGTARSYEARNGKPPGVHEEPTAFIVSSELSSSIVGNSSALDIFTDLADRIFNEGKWNYLLKTSESVNLSSPTVTWLAGSNEDLFRAFVPEKNLKGGLIGRMFIISERQTEVYNSLMFPPKRQIDKAKIAKGIEHVAKLKGEFHIPNSVRESFHEWYIEFRKKVEPKLQDETGTVGRIVPNILKIAMLISTARRADMTITEDDMEEAMKEILALLASSRKVASTAEQNEKSAMEKRSLVLRYLARNGGSVTKTEILRGLRLKIDHEDLDKISSFLEQAEVITIGRGGGEIMYSFNMQKKGIEEYVEQYRH